MNNITNGGAVKKSLIVPVAPTGVGKSFFMTAWAAYLLKLGYNVLYITLEMAEEKIAERIDSNLFDIALNDLKTIPQDIFTNKINKFPCHIVWMRRHKSKPIVPFYFVDHL